jgi:hypothetical protein
MSIERRPKFLYIPGSSKTGKIYSQLPKDGSGDASGFTRSSTVLSVGSDGFLQSNAVNDPAHSYLFGSCPELQLQNYALTNLTSDSNEFDAATWQDFGVSLADVSAQSPDGTVNAWLVTNDDTGVTAHGVRNSENPTTIVGRWYYHSVFAKIPSGSSCTGVYMTNAAESNRNAYFNLINGTVGTTGVNTKFANIYDYGNGWYRCMFAFEATLTIAQLNIRLVIGNEIIAWNGDGSESLYLFGAETVQNSGGALAPYGEYIPTSGSVASVGVESIATFTLPSGGATQGSFVFHGRITDTVTAVFINFGSSDQSNRGRINVLGDQPTYYSVNTGYMTQPTGVDNFEEFKFGVSVDNSGNVSLFFNGVLTDDAVNALHQFDQIQIAGTFTKHIKSLAWYSEKLSDAEMITLTTL